MRYWYQKPNQQLAGYIRTVLILEGFSQPVQNQLPLVTTGMAVLFCKLEKEEHGNENPVQLSLFGKPTTPGCWTTGSGTTILAYFFKPFAMASMFNLPAARLAEAPVELSTWSPHKTNALKLQLIGASSTQDKVETLDHLLIHQLQQQKKECEAVLYATDEMLLRPDNEILATIKDRLGINERTFQRMFKKYVGVSPNHYRRICQFQDSFAQLRARDFSKLTDIAYDNGFADQSHFIRAFREFTRVTPNDYLRGGLKKDQ